MARIRIEDLPSTRDLSPEELKDLLGAGRYRPQVEQLESRELMASNISANLVAGVLKVEGSAAPDHIVIRKIEGGIQIDGTKFMGEDGRIPVANP